jgi:hypothetical protein
MGGALGSCVWAIEIARRDELHRIVSDLKVWATGPIFSSSAWWTYRAVELFAVYMLVAIPVLLVAAFRTFTEAITRTFLVVTGLLCAATAYSALGLGDVYAFTFDGLGGCGDPRAKIDFVLRGLLEAQHLLAFCTRAIVGVGIIGIAACSASALGDACRGQVASRRATIGSGVLLVLGISVFAATRRAAADAQREISYRPVANRCPPEAVAAALITYPCGDLMDAPVLALRDGGIFVDGWPAQSDSELVTALGKKVTFWKQINPGREFPANVLAIAPGNALARALPLARLHEVGFRHVQLAMGHERERLETATIGTFVLRPRCCGIELDLDPAAARFSPDATYEDLLRAAAKAKNQGSVLRVAP